MPPSAITGVFAFFATSTASMMAVSCGTPTPATMRVVQIEPGPMPTLIEFGACVDQSSGAFAGRDIAGHHLDRVRHALDAGHGVEHAPRMTMRGIDHDEIDAGSEQALAARIAGLADRRGSSHPQPALLVLAGVRVRHGLFDVLHRDKADAAIVGIDNQKLLDAILVQELFRFVLANAFADRDEPLLGHQLGDFLPLVSRKAHVAVGEDADELARGSAVLAVAAAFDDRECRKYDAPASLRARRRVSPRDGW